MFRYVFVLLCLDVFDVGSVKNNSIDVFGNLENSLVKSESVLVVIMARTHLSQLKIVHPLRFTIQKRKEKGLQISKEKKNSRQESYIDSLLRLCSNFCV